MTCLVPCGDRQPHPVISIPLAEAETAWERSVAAPVEMPMSRDTLRDEVRSHLTLHQRKQKRNAEASSNGKKAPRMP